jgi:hypothetical protein
MVWAIREKGRRLLNIARVEQIPADCGARW